MPLPRTLGLRTERARQLRTEVDEKVRAMLALDGWQPDMDLAAQAGYFSMSRLREGGIPGVTDT